MITRRDTLKAIAAFAMLVDHIGAIFFPGYLIFRVIGRISFPIYAYLLCDGLQRSSNQGKMLLRIGLLALISEPAFDFAFFGGLNVSSQNIFWTHFLGLSAIRACQRDSAVMTKGASVLLACTLGEILSADYGAIGVMLIVLLGIARQRRRYDAGIVIGLFSVGMFARYSSAVYLAAMAAILLIPKELETSPQVTQKGVKIGYLFYPLHLLVLGVISKLALLTK